MTALTASTLGELVRERPARASVLDRYRLDYCCGGDRTLDDACATAGIDAAVVSEALQAFDATPEAASEPDLEQIPLPELLDHIVSTHHVFLKEELPRLTALAAKVGRRHGPLHPHLVELDRVVQALAEELTLHLQKEEEVLFPWIRQLCGAVVEGQAPMAGACGASVAAPIAVMEQEHETAGAALAKIRELAGDFSVPEEACNSWRALYAGLEMLEADTHRHIHKENCAVHPRALALISD